MSIYLKFLKSKKRVDALLTFIQSKYNCNDLCVHTRDLSIIDALHLCIFATKTCKFPDNSKLPGIICLLIDYSASNFRLDRIEDDLVKYTNIDIGCFITQLEEVVLGCNNKCSSK